MINNPLEQFSIRAMGLCCCDAVISLLITNLVIFFLLCLFLIFVVVFAPLFWSGRISNIYVVLNNGYSFVNGLFINQLSNKAAVRFFPYFFLCFIFVLASNFSGIFPYSFTITSHFIQTLSLSLSSFLGIFILGFVNFETKFLQIFVPKNVPNVLVPFLIVLEIVSYLIRPFSLAIRLFANMLAGHILLHILLSFNFFLLNKQLVLFFVITFIIAFLIFILEFSIVFIQAYVFLTLLLIYPSDAFNLH